MNDHELDDQMRRMAQSYNEPPDIPRDAMWARIESARYNRAPIALASRRIRWLRMGAGIAAALLVGIGIGRLSRGSDALSPNASVTASLQSATGDSVTGQSVPLVAAASAPSDAGGASAALVSSSGDSDATNPVRATREERLRELREQRTGTSRALAANGVPRGVQGAVGEGSEMSAYRLAVVEHMARTEVLLTSFLADSRNSPNVTRTAAQFAALSRDLLKTTRLLLATRTSEDPALTRLLEDLELVLMQISQYTSEGRRGDLDAINQSLDRRNVLPKLRSTIPAGASASTGI